MPAFAYQALDQTGKTQRGVMQGDTARAVRASLRERGMNPLEVAPVTETSAQRASFFHHGLSSAQSRVADAATRDATESRVACR